MPERSNLAQAAHSVMSHSTCTARSRACDTSANAAGLAIRTAPQVAERVEHARLALSLGRVLTRRACRAGPSPAHSYLFSSFSRSTERERRREREIV